MKLLLTCSIGLLLLFSWSPADAQVTNLTVNGSTTNFSMASGDAVSWTFDIPSGQGALVTIWFDLNGNGIAEPGTDKIFAQFVQTDGDPNGGNGPPDMDGVANGHVTFSQPLGLAPNKYVFNATHNGSGQSVPGTISPLLSPNGTISGTVTPPLGKEKRNIVVEASQRSDTTSQGGGDKMFWDALTDSNGAYTINIHTDSSTTFWRVSVSDNFAPSVASPAQTILVLHTAVSGINFGYLAPAAQVAGFVYDDSMTPIPGTDVYMSSYPGNIFRSSRTDGTGFFQLGLEASDLSGQSWRLQTSQNGNTTTTVMQASREIGVVNNGDSLHRDLIVYNTNSQIEGYVRVNGSAPGYPAFVAAVSADTAQANVYSDSTTGHFIIPVTNKISGYSLNIWNLPFNAGFSPVPAQPGDTGKILNIIVSSVIERGAGVPEGFALYQNYPNPFNPMTGIRYDLPKASYVKLAVFSLLGEEIAKLWDGEQTAGSYTVRFDASALPSGVYFYRLTAGSSVATQKMILMK